VISHDRSLLTWWALTTTTTTATTTTTTTTKCYFSRPYICSGVHPTIASPGAMGREV